MKLFRVKVNITFIIIAAILLLIFLHYTGILSPLENLFIKIISPLQSQVYSLSSGIREKAIENETASQDIKQENQELKSKIEQLTVENAELKILEEENKNLEEQLKLVTELGYQYISCRVVSKEIDISSNILILNCGSNHGIKKGQSVVVHPGIIVGKIIEAKPTLSRLLLITSSNSKTAATILNQEKTLGIVTGEKDSSIKMELIPTQAQVNENDIVVTSGLENFVPEGLIIGQVSSIALQANNFFQTAVLKPLINYETIKIVSVIILPTL